MESNKSLININSDEVIAIITCINCTRNDLQKEIEDILTAEKESRGNAPGFELIYELKDISSSIDKDLYKTEHLKSAEYSLEIYNKLLEKFIAHSRRLDEDS